MKKITFQITSATKISTLLLTFVFLFSIVSAFSQASKTDYTGKWTLNESKSKLGEGPGRRAASQMVITQDANILTNEKTSTRPTGETMTSTEKYNLDGTESDNSSTNRTKKSTASWTTDMKQLIIKSVTVFERDGNTMEMKSVEIYKLGSDGLSLVIDAATSSERGDFQTTLYYDKAK
jgi:hypothetical protein